MAPPAWPRMPISGPAIAWASARQRVAHRGHDVLGDRLDEPLPHVDGLLDPLGAAPRGGGAHAGGEARWRSRASGRRAAGRRRPRARCRSVGDGSGSWATVCRATSLASVQFTEPSCGAIIACIWPISADRSGIRRPAGRRAPGRRTPPSAPRSALKICSNGVPLNGLCRSRPVVGRSPGSLLMGPNYSPRPTAAVPRLD